VVLDLSSRTGTVGVRAPDSDVRERYRLLEAFDGALGYLSSHGKDRQELEKAREDVRIRYEKRSFG
jgi:hypothetical protein